MPCTCFTPREWSSSCPAMGRKKKSYQMFARWMGTVAAIQLCIATKKYILFVIFVVAPICTHSKLSSLSTLLHDSPTAAFCSTTIQTCSKSWKRKPCYDHFHPLKKQFVTSGQQVTLRDCYWTHYPVWNELHSGTHVVCLASISVNIFTRAQRQTPPLLQPTSTKDSASVDHNSP